MKTAGVRLGFALTLVLLALNGVVSGQSNTPQFTPLPVTQSIPPTPKPYLEQPKTMQSQEVSEEFKALIPPAPNIVKRDSRVISIPLEGIVQLPKYEQRPAVLSDIKIGSLFGYRRDPFTRRARFHSGVDIKARWGDPVAASHSGTIQFAGWYHGYGNLVIVDHDGGVTTYYAHLSSYALSVGEKVERGTVVGYAGSTGRATSPHLHYEVRLDGNAINPLQQVALDPSSPYFKSSRPSVDRPGPKDVSPNRLGAQQ